MTVYLSVRQILFIHARLVAETGGGSGVRDLGLLQSATARPQATFDGRDLYTDLWHKAAALMASLAQNHPFVDGNKRVAITAAALMLRRNGYALETTNAEMVRFTLHVVTEHPPLEEIARWLEAHAVALY